MKSAKEWAAEVVTEPEELDHDMWSVFVRDPTTRDDRVRVSLVETSGEDDARDLCHDARAIIERVVERVQADARAPLEAEISRLREENEQLKLNEMHADRLTQTWISLLGRARDRLKRAMEPGADTSGYVKELVEHMDEWLTL
jgi:hypothetical protein